MDHNLRSLSYVILFASLSAISALGIIGFLNNAYAINANTSDSMNMSANMNTNGKMTANVTANGNMSMTNMHKIFSPLQQFKSGVSAKSVQCNQGFTLIIKQEDSSPACVSSQIAQALTARGWGTTP